MLQQIHNSLSVSIKNCWHKLLFYFQMASEMLPFYFDAKLASFIHPWNIYAVVNMTVETQFYIIYCECLFMLLKKKKKQKRVCWDSETMMFAIIVIAKTNKSKPLDKCPKHSHIHKIQTIHKNQHQYTWRFIHNPNKYTHTRFHTPRKSMCQNGASSKNK